MRRQEERAEKKTGAPVRKASERGLRPEKQAGEGIGIAYFSR